MKIYAKQVPPEYQESPLFRGGPEFWPEGVAICGNRHFNRHTFPDFDRVENALENGLVDDLDNVKDGRRVEFSSFTDCLNWYLHPLDAERGKPFSTWEIHRLRLAVFQWAEGNTVESVKAFCEILSIVTGKKYEWRQLCGCCQGDWQECYYPAEEWSREALDGLESEYFNTGSEWEIHDGDGEPGGPEDISGYYVYCTGWNDDQIKQEIRDAAGDGEGEVILYPFKGYTRTPVYGEAV